MSPAPVDELELQALARRWREVPLEERRAVLDTLLAFDVGTADHLFAAAGLPRARAHTGRGDGMAMLDVPAGHPRTRVAEPRPADHVDRAAVSMRLLDLSLNGGAARTLYRGWRDEPPFDDGVDHAEMAPLIVDVQRETGPGAYDRRRLARLVNHVPPDMPYPFECGFGSARSKELALAILFDAVVDAGLALHYHSRFIWDVVAKLPRDTEWTVLEHEVLTWLASAIDSAYDDAGRI